MIAFWSHRMKGGDKTAQDDDRLDGRLRDLDDYLTRVFTADLDDPDLRALFARSVVRRIDDERERDRAARAVETRKGSWPGLNAVGAGFMWLAPHCGQLAKNKKAWLVALGCALLVITLLVTLHGSPPRSERGGVANDLPEKPDLKLSIMTTTDLIPFWLAVDNNYFKEAGFTFDAWKDVTKAKSGSESVQKLVGNEVDIAYSTYTPFIAASSRGVADIKLVAGASSAAPGSCVVVAAPGSRVKSIRDMAGARVAVTAKNTMSDLLIRSALKSAGVDSAGIQWIEMPFKDMASKLAVGEVDAAFMTEPFLSQAKKTINAVPIFDTAPAKSPTAGIPTAGFGASADFVAKYPRTVAAFQRVMARATSEARGDRSKVESLLQKSAEVDADTARTATLLTFESSLDVAAIQRVADLMYEFGMVNQRIDASQLIAALSAN